MKPSNSGETFWMFLSLLCLPLEKQLAIIGGVASSGDESTAKHGTNADLVLWVLQEYYIGWFDEVNEGGAAREIMDLIETDVFGSRNYLSDFKEAEAWIKLRGLAAQALFEAGLDLWPIDGTIDFNEFIELQYSQEIGRE
jgi:hypothetical protein